MCWWATKRLCCAGEVPSDVNPSTGVLVVAIVALDLARKMVRGDRTFVRAPESRRRLGVVDVRVWVWVRLRWWHDSKNVILVIR